MSLTVEELSKKTVMELKAYAKKNNIELFDSKTKLEILEIFASWAPNENVQVDIKKKEKDSAVYSKRNIHWSGVGTLSIGYNIVTKEDAEKWATRKSVRIASPEEVARHYGK
jgi:hypothetical protein